MTLEQQQAMLAARRALAKTNVDLAETALAAAEAELRRIDNELDLVSEAICNILEQRLRRRA
jgi:hypothetical protein